MMLENLFHHNSHPSRQERDTIAKAGNMCVVFFPAFTSDLRVAPGKPSRLQFGSKTNAKLKGKAPNQFLPLAVHR